MCDLNGIIADAQAETGIDLVSVTTESVLSEHLLRYRQKLLSMTGTAWKDVEVGDVDITISGVQGWGRHWGYHWGGRHRELAISLPLLEGIWQVRARRIAEGDWPVVFVVTMDDAEAVQRPRLLLQQQRAVLLDFDTDWDGIYDQLRFEALPVPAVGLAMNVELAPNELMAPGFCRCLVLEGARFLALKSGDLVLAGGMAADLGRARSVLQQQARAQAGIVTLGISNGTGYS